MSEVASQVEALSVSPVAGQGVEQISSDIGGRAGVMPRISGVFDRVANALKWSIVLGSAAVASCQNSGRMLPAAIGHQPSAPGESVEAWPLAATPSWGPGNTIVFHGDASSEPFEVSIANTKNPFAPMLVTVEDANQRVDVSELGLSAGDVVTVTETSGAAATLELEPFGEETQLGQLDL